MKRSLSSVCGCMLFGALGCASLGSHADHSMTASQVEDSCDGLDSTVREQRLLGDQFEVRSSRALYTRSGKQMTRRPVGVQFSVAPRRGIDSVWLERAARCHMNQHAAAAARGEPASADDPLSIEGAEVRVRDSQGYYILQLTSRHPATARRLAEYADQHSD
ncbi:MAG: hypothetical protein B7733_07045 [Myxococcales bacterium FL481]|nr:MAG: hypothetical protein B7733_07045 [Myxococcales bacterium FL481]